MNTVRDLFPLSSFLANVCRLNPSGTVFNYRPKRESLDVDTAILGWDGVLCVLVRRQCHVLHLRIVADAG